MKTYSKQGAYKNNLWSATLLNRDSGEGVFLCEFCEIFKSTFFTEHLRMTASDIRMQEVIIYNLNLSLQFVKINFTSSLMRVFTLAHALMSLKLCVDLLFGRVTLSHALQDSF